MTLISFRLSGFALLFVAAAATARAASTPADWKLPPLDGEISGEFNPLLLGGAPKLNWKLAVQTKRPRERSVDFEITGHGCHLRGSAVVDPRGEGTWRIADAQIDLAAWFGWLAPQVMPAMSTVTAGGNLTVAGEGAWRGGRLDGKAQLSLREGKIDDPAHKILLEGISVDIDMADLARRRTEPAQVFTWRSGRYDVVKLGVGRIEFQLAGEELRVTKAALDVFGGELNVGSLVMSTARPEFSVTARVTGIAVDQILFLLPPILSEAKGRLDGNVALRRAESGIQIGDGRLALREGETADLRLAVKPGWLSTSLPPDIMKYFPGFRKIETGEIPIRARVLEITLTPDGDPKGRTAWVHLAGGPSDPDLTAPIDMNVNVRGRLDTLVKIGADLGTDSRLHFGGAR